MKRALLATIPILLASAVLLLSDWDQRKRAPKPALDRKHTISFVQLNNVVDVEESESGFLAGLNDAGLIEGRDYEIRKQNAQGDMATVSALIDNAVAQGSDVLVTFSTPTLQAAIQRAGKVPVVFTYVADGVIAGAGKSRTDHLPNVTGVDFVAANVEMLKIVRELMPRARKLGNVVVPSEVNSVFLTGALVKDAQGTGIRIVSMPASTSSEVPDAATALVSSGVDAICQVPGNITAAAFASIAHAAARARIPVFAFQTVQARQGAAVVLSRDYHDSGHLACDLALRVLRGESPAAIPIQAIEKTKLMINLPAAKLARLHLPPDLVQRAAEVIRH